MCIPRVLFLLQRARTSTNKKEKSKRVKQAGGARKQTERLVIQRDAAHNRRVGLDVALNVDQALVGELGHRGLQLILVGGLQIGVIAPRQLCVRTSRVGQNVVRQARPQTTLPFFSFLSFFFLHACSHSSVFVFRPRFPLLSYPLSYLLSYLVQLAVHVSEELRKLDAAGRQVLQERLDRPRNVGDASATRVGLGGQSNERKRECEWRGRTRGRPQGLVAPCRWR